jgi:hypothetical protein
MATTEAKPEATPRKQAAVDAPAAETRRPKPTLALATALLALATGGVGLVYTFWPGLRPDPRVVQAATLRIVAKEDGVSVGEYAHRRKRSTKGLSRAEACIPGNVFYVEEHLEGFKGRSTTLVRNLYDASTRHRIRGALRSVNGGVVEPIRSSRPTNQQVSLAWSQWPYRNGSFFVRFELYRGGTLLGVVDTKAFSITKSRYTTFFGQCWRSARGA